MDLVLLQPGNPDIISEAGEGGSLIEGTVNKVDGVDLSGCVELLSYHYSMKQQMTTDVSNSARTSGRPDLTDITCVKYYDKTSTAFYKHCLVGKPIDSGDPSKPTKLFLLRNAPGDDDNSTIANIMTIEMQNVMISSIECQSHPNDMATEQFTLNFTDIQWTYSAQKSDASIQGVKVANWSVARNRPLAFKQY
ncbi:MAG: type VI secretion system tube protein Hcp [Acidiferrobacterales bacterium]|nr:type VI secretion system tube protein Hcp [Acidiferrobacterales bacterium]